MLDLYFLNVGDGDSVLLRQQEADGRDFVFLVDCGRPALEYVKDSLRAEAVYSLLDLGVKRIDLMLLTHFHIDHVGGCANILRHIPVETLLAPYIPSANARWQRPPFETRDKKRIGFFHMMNFWADSIREARKHRVHCGEYSAGPLPLSEGLEAEVIFPRQDLADRQHEVMDALYRGKPVEPDTVFATANDRNIAGPLLLIRYRGRLICLTADVYASEWEGLDLPPCDILKLPHHGDPKSMTEALIEKLRPVCAVASCQNDPKAAKDRPNADIAALVQRHCREFICTENKPLPTLPPATHRWVQYRITDEGELLTYTEE